MRCFAQCVTPVLLVLLVLLGCRQDEADRASLATSIEAAAPAEVRTAEPCTLALVSHTGSERVDQDITHLQHKVRQASEPAIYLERLGWAFITKARLSFDPGFYKLAEQCALCLDAQRPGSAEALLLRGHILHQLHQFHEAETLARQLVQQRGLWFDHGLLGDVLMEQGHLEEAVAAYQQMMDQKPGPQAYSRAAHVRWLTGDLFGAIEAMQMAVSAGSIRDPEATAWTSVRLALYELQAGRQSRATSALAAALTILPDYAPALLVQGRMHLAAGDASVALAPLKRAAQLNPLPEYLWWLLEALRATGHDQEAHTVATQLRQQGALTDRRTLALYLATMGQESETAVQLAEAELASRTDVLTLDALAWALYAAGRGQEARHMSQRAATVGTQDARLFYHAGVIAAAVGKYDEARDWCARAEAIGQMLLPSERAHLAAASAAIPSPLPVLTWQLEPDTEHINDNSEGRRE